MGLLDRRADLRQRLGLIGPGVSRLRWIRRQIDRERKETEEKRRRSAWIRYWMEQDGR